MANQHKKVRRPRTKIAGKLNSPVLKILTRAGTKLIGIIQRCNLERVAPALAVTTSQPLIAEWPLSPAATLGSSIRTKGIERELRARLSWAVRKHVKAETGGIALRMPEDEVNEFGTASATISRTLEGVEELPVLPREAEDVLAISSRERHKWVKDGRLQSIGTRWVKMRGRSKKVTFHVFDPRHIEDVLDRDLPTVWQEEDAREVAENRRRGAGKAALTRAGKGDTKAGAAKCNQPAGDPSPRLEGWGDWRDGATSRTKAY